MKPIQKHLEEGNLVVFVGAGCSMIPPTNLPSWWQVNRAVIDALVRHTESLLPEARELGELIELRQDAYKLPPEYFAEVVAGTLGSAYFEVLRSLDSQTPNAVHLALAALAGKGKLGAIVTTNFDRTIEAAFEELGLPIEVRYRDEHMKKLAEDLDRIGQENSPCQLLKIHGSAQEADSLIDTLSQRKRGLPEPTVRCIKHLLRWGHWLFLGYSGADLEADPNYLFLRASMPEARGFTWLTLEGSSPLPTVADLAEAYGDKASIEYGKLPEWLDFLLESSNLEAIGMKAAPVPSGVNAAVGAQADAWAEGIGDFASAVVLASLLEVAGHAPRAIDAMKVLYNYHPRSKEPVHVEELEGESLAIRWGTEDVPPDRGRVLIGGEDNRVLAYYHGPTEDADDLEQQAFYLLCLRLATLLARQGSLEEALPVYQHALAVSAAAGATDRIAMSMGQYASLLKNIGELDAAESMFKRAIVAASGYPHVRGDLHNDLASVFAAQGRLGEARSAVQEALRARTLTGDELGRAGALTNLANLSGYDEAPQHYEAALAILERIGNEHGRSQVLINLGKLHRNAGDLKRSEQIYEAALLTSERIADQRGVAMALHGLAVAKDENKEFEPALDLYQQALHVAEAIGLKSECASIYNNMARLHRDLQEHKAMATARQRALSLYEEMNSPQGEADTWYAMGVDALIFEQPTAAIEPSRNAFRIYTDLGNIRRRLEAGNNLASALYDTDQLVEASALYEELLPEAEENGLSDLAARMTIGLGKGAFRDGSIEQGKRWFTQAVAIQLQLGGPMAAYDLARHMADRSREDYGYEATALEFVGPLFNDIARELMEQGHHEQALDYIKQLRDVATREDDEVWLATALANMGYVFRLSDRQDEAIEHLREAVQHYNALNDPKGAIFPLTNLVQLLGDRDNKDALAEAMQELGRCYQAIGEKLQAAETYAQAASLWLVPFGEGAVSTAAEARDRVERADQLLTAAHPILVEAKSPFLERAEYDLAFCQQVISSLE